MCKNARRQFLRDSPNTELEATEQLNNEQNLQAMPTNSILLFAKEFTFITDYTIKKVCGPMCVQLKNS